MKLLATCFLIFYSTVLFSVGSDFRPQTISTREIIGFQSYPPKVKKMIEIGLELTKRNLTYQYGSSDPKQGGMDCSGTMYYLLTQMGVQSVPRSSDDLYQWIKSKGVFYSANRGLKYLRPGDLLFWTGTYSAPGNAYVTHVMIYLGKNREGEPLMLGSSNGRTYQGKKIYGVSIFDFLEPHSTSNPNFLGYSCIPEVSC